MAIQINLLPDARQAKLRDRHRRKLVTGIATLVCGSCVGLLFVLFLVTQGQRLRTASLQRDIDERQTRIEAVPEIGRMLTVQKNLAALPGLYEQRVLLTQFFRLLQGTSPRQFAVSTLEMDADNNLKVTGRARNIALVSKFAKALEASKPGGTSSETPGGGEPYFTNVELTNVAADGDGNVTFQLTAGVGQGALRANQ